MGGNALKNTYTERKNKDDYNKIKKNILDKTSDIIKYSVVIELPGKETFGDLDILYISDKNLDIKKIIIDLFTPNEIVHNGDVISFDYEKFQIDFIKVQKEYFEMANFYFSYGDLGAIIGRLTNYYGAKFGHFGLWINLLYNTLDKEKDLDCRNILARIDLTNNPLQICNFFDLDYDIWKNGFNDKVSIFRWIISSKYYKKDIFSTLNYDHRRRANLRPFYQDFLDYIDQDITLIKKANSGTSEILDNQQEVLIKYFKKEEEVKIIFDKIKLDQTRKEKFSGKNFIDIGIDSKKIGESINTFKKYILEKNQNINSFEEWLDKNTKEDVYDLITQFKCLNM